MIAVLIEASNGQVKKSSLESLSLASQSAKLSDHKITALLFGSSEISVDLGKYGADEVVHFTGSESYGYSEIADSIIQYAKEYNPLQIFLSLNSTGKNIAGILAAKLHIGLISGVTNVSLQHDKLVFVKNVFSGKASAWYSLSNNQGIITAMPNGVQIDANHNKPAHHASYTATPSASKVKRIDKKLVSGKIPLTEATIVVSAGRGMKDPANWGMIEELADLLGATTACSRPVADAGWRPHHEHVGQTGIAIRPNVYIAIGISGAIQHLAGVNNSHKIIVINKDPEAPFFKAADYGICGDLFDVIPKLNQAIIQHKNKV